MNGVIKKNLKFIWVMIVAVVAAVVIDGLRPSGIISTASFICAPVFCLFIATSDIPIRVKMTACIVLLVICTAIALIVDGIEDSKMRLIIYLALVPSTYLYSVKSYKDRK